MALTVAGAMQLDVFGRVPWRVYAGKAHLDRTVRWVHPNEAPDIARFLTGGEMLLTAGTGIGSSAGQQRAYVRDIAEAGAAVLVLELSGRAFRSMPRALADEAARCGLPLVGLSGEIPFVEVSGQVHERLIEERVSELAGYERFNNVLMEALRTGEDYVALADRLADEAKAPVVLEDAAHRILAHAAPTSSSEAVVSAWEQHARLGHAVEEEAICTRRAIFLHGERWGWVHLLHGDTVLGPAQVHALERTADAVAISVLSVRESHARASQRESALVNRLMLGDITGEAFIARALRLGKDLRRRRLVAVWADGAGGVNAADGLNAVAQDLGLTVVVADAGDSAVAVLGLRRAQDLGRLRESLTRRLGAAGVSRVCAASDLSGAVRQARSAASVAANRPGSAAILFDELGVLRLLVPLAQGPELANYVEDEIGTLLRHDAESNNPLLPTLRAFVTCGGNKSAAAAELVVQRRTLYYRLDRISTLLGKNLDDPEVLQTVTFAVRALDLIRGPARQPQ